MVLLFLFLLSTLLHISISTRVQLSTGTIEGKILTSTYSPLGNHTGIGFLGIPFVEPPAGNLRFRKPRPPIPWDGILETKEYKPACMSDAKKTYKNGVGGPISEDCLYANVFTNQYCMKRKNCSVMIVVHGGRILTESASAFNPEILVNNFVGQGRNIVVVTFNYRLGTFGFGVLNGEKGDSNVGMFDMLEAVKWTRKEVHNFGGNKDKLTMVGHSAGGSLVGAFTSSPLSKGMLNQQIIMSGALYQMGKLANFKGMTAMAQKAGCLPEVFGFRKLSQVRIDKTYSCLRNISAQEVLDAQLWVLQNTTYYISVPHIDGEFLLNYSDEILASGTIHPINSMIGTTTAELRDPIYINDLKNADKKEELLKNLCEHIGYELYTEPEEFSRKCQKFYGNGDDAQFLADDMEFYDGSIKVANAHASKNTKVFMYSYDYKDAGPAFKKYAQAPPPHHSEDLIYVFGTSRGNFTEKDYVIEQIYSGMFADFVNFGNPSPSKEQKWKEYSPEKREYFLIDFDKNFTMPGTRDGYYSRALEFWSTAGTKSFSEHYSPSLDSFTTGILIDPIVSHMKGVATGPDKTFEQFEKMLLEREMFLKTLKSERKLELLKEKWRKIRNGGGRIVERAGNAPMEMRDGKKGSRGGVSLLLIIFGGTLLGGILYVTISHFCLHHKSREGYQLLK
ncbi:Carboxylesterase type B domain-containing protein [Caenorhabditis elegans]|uniref:Carboxylesterase type B domain-containing protein n=1 Tax=Caenorhabditis elegans TaxID=6239 RepID=G5EDJ7_CAEEL|nr:Carboxylesterase type B domain-containing protein [Caenorhabditis elegans]CAB00887.2 Carboxylesterase type B domain-containing protein [Caenorhabditis elegans]|eukprot:NP_506508.2 Uncharacterized protein CELE_ZC376.3 [Caenorhabditis elegans]